MADLDPIQPLELMTRLDQGLRIALADNVFTEDEMKRQRVVEIIRRTVCNDDRADKNDAVYDATLDDFQRLLDPVVTPLDGSPKVNGIWQSNAFLAPAIAAMAQLFDRMIDPRNDSAMTLTVRPTSTSLFGYELIGLHATGKKIDPDTGLWVATALQKHELLRLSTMLGAAAQFALIQDDTLSAGANYLHTEANRTAISRANERNSTASKGTKTQQNVVSGASSYIMVAP